jgi:hypothetical protein
MVWDVSPVNLTDNKIHQSVHVQLELILLVNSVNVSHVTITVLNVLVLLITVLLVTMTSKTIHQLVHVKIGN